MSERTMLSESGAVAFAEPTTHGATPGSSAASFPESTAGASSLGSSSSGSEAVALTPSSSSRVPRWLGKRVGRFRLVAMIGSGAWGRVFEAEDTTLRRRVALKLIPIRRKDGTPKLDFDRVVREARAAAALEHPHVIQVFEVGEHKDLFFIAMELAEGGSLEDVIRAAGPMDAVRACRLAAEAGDALALGHACGIIHRDVKPGNLLISRGGRCKVTDFGLALVNDPGDPWHGTRVAGTSYYVAPETIRGHRADGRSDMYSLGATLFHMLAGRKPFEGSSRSEVLKAHLHREAPDLRSLRPEIDPKLAALVAKAMSKDPAQRFASMEQFSRALRLFTVPVAAPVVATEAPAPAPAAPAAIAVDAPRRTAARRQRGSMLASVMRASKALAVAIQRRRLLDPSYPERWLTIAGIAGAMLLGGALWFAVHASGKPAIDTAALRDAPREAIDAAAIAGGVVGEPGHGMVRHTFELDTTAWPDQPTSVHLAGDFNQWSPDASPLTDPEGDGVWTAAISLRPGLHLYRFVIDGRRWLSDPASDKSLDRPDHDGGINSGVAVRGP